MTHSPTAIALRPSSMLLGVVVALLGLNACGGAAVQTPPTLVERGEPRLATPKVTAIGIGANGVELRADFKCVQTVTDIYCNQRTWEAYHRCIERKVLRTSEQEVACDQAKVRLGGPDRVLVIQPPWSDKGLLVSLDDRFVGKVEVDWASSGVDPLSGDAATLLARPWKLRYGDASAEWVPSADDIAAMAAEIGRATGIETEVGPAEGEVDLKVVGFRAAEALQAGEPGRMTLTIANRGTGAAYRVVAQTRSSVVALHARHFSFGLLKAGQEKTREVRVEIPDDVRVESAMVVVHIEEANGNAATHSERFAITALDRPKSKAKSSDPCPQGRLSRAEYDQKRKRLKAAFDAGGLTQEEFDRYDAELVNCLE